MASITEERGASGIDRLLAGEVPFTASGGRPAREVLPTELVLRESTGPVR